MQKLIATIIRCTFDLVAGTATANISEHIFHKDFDAVFTGKEGNVAESEIMTAKMIRVWMQMVFTIFMAMELRNLYTSEETEDPTGGMVFIWAASQMPRFWTKVQEMALMIRHKFFGVGISKPTLAE